MMAKQIHMQICQSLYALQNHVIQEVDDFMCRFKNEEKILLKNTLEHTKFHLIGDDSIGILFITPTYDQHHISSGIFMSCAHSLQRDVFFDPSSFGLDRRENKWDRQISWEIDLVMYRLIYAIFSEFERRCTRQIKSQRVPLSLAASAALNLSTKDIIVLKENIPNYKLLFANPVTYVEFDKILSNK